MNTSKLPIDKKIVIFASGEGSNALNIIRFFESNENIKIVHVLSNNIRANALKKAHDYEISALHFDRDALYNTNDVLNVLVDANPDLIVLAGFLWKIPEKIIKAFPNKIINIHPALLPKYGGKGMYGKRVHEAVLKNKDLQTGITIHYINEVYDEGKIIDQFKIPISEEDNLESLLQKIKKIEHENYPKVIEKILMTS